MCLLLTEEEYERPFLTAEDMTVYKLFKKYSCLMFESIFVEYAYTVDKLYTTEMQQISKTGIYDPETGEFKVPLQHFDAMEIELFKKKLVEIKQTRFIGVSDGFHWFSNLSRAIDSCKLCANLYCVVECIVPANSKYYIGSADLGVSEKIIVTDKVLFKNSQFETV